MKIISGKFKGSKLFLPQNKVTRPLKNIVKEAIFNLLNHSNKFSDYVCFILPQLFESDGKGVPRKRVKGFNLLHFLLACFCWPFYLAYALFKTKFKFQLK